MSDAAHDQHNASHGTSLLPHDLTPEQLAAAPVLASVTVAELRYGAIIADCGAPRRNRIEMAIAEATVAPVTDALITAIAELRATCRQVGHPLADRIHANDLWIAASAVHIAAALVTVDSIFEGAPGLDVAQ